MFRRHIFLFGVKRPELHIDGVGIFGWLESRVEVKETCANIILYETYDNNNHNNIMYYYETTCNSLRSFPERPATRIVWRGENSLTHNGGRIWRFIISHYYYYDYYVVLALALVRETKKNTHKHTYCYIIIIITAFSIFVIAGLYGFQI